jgi:cell division protein FtsQ
MARKGSPTILQEELYSPGASHERPESARAEYSRDSRSERSHSDLSYSDRPHDDWPQEQLDDDRLIDLNVNEESPFLRAQKRVSARRSTLPKKTAFRLLWAAAAAAILFLAVIVAAGVYHYGEHSWRFRIESSDNIEIIGMRNTTKAQIMEVMGADIGRNIFFIPLAQQRAQLEQIPWVESASVMRFVPNRLKVEIHERTPVAFARVGPRIFLIDAAGTLMDLPRNHKYSFPVVLGMNPGEPLSTRAPRMQAYNELVRELDSGGAHYSQDLSEVDVSDLDDLKIRVNDPAGDVLVELGSSDYLKRYKTYISHVQEWRQQFQKLESVNLRYDNQVIVNPDMEGKPKQPALTAAAARAAAAAGVKAAALITRMSSPPRALPKPAFELSKATLESAEGKKPAVKPKLKKAAAHAKFAPMPKAVQAGVQKPAQKDEQKTAQKTATRQMAKASTAPQISAPATPQIRTSQFRTSQFRRRPARKKSAAKKPAQSAAPPSRASPKPSPAIAKPSAGANG